MKKKRRRVWSDGLAVGVCLLILALLAVPTLRLFAQANAHATCLLNLRRIGLACLAYAEAHDTHPLPAGTPSSDDGTLDRPNRLEAADSAIVARRLLQEGNLDDPGIFACPAAPQKPAESGTLPGESNISYAWSRLWPLSPKTPAPAPLAADRRVRKHDEWHKTRNVLFVDGRVKSFEKTDPAGLDDLDGAVRRPPPVPEEGENTPPPGEHWERNFPYLILIFVIFFAYFLLRVIRWWGKRKTGE